MRKIFSIINKFLIVFTSLGGVLLNLIFYKQDGYSSWGKRLLYFTNLSNIWIGITCLVLAILLIIKMIKPLSNYFENINYFDIHHISKLDKVSGTTYLFMLQNSKIKLKSYKTDKNNITYVVQMTSKYDKLVLSYQVNDKIVFAKGLVNYLNSQDDSMIINLLE